MALRIRMQRGGTTHNPRYRLVVTEARNRRDGRCVEYLGVYNPTARGKDVPYDLKLDRIDYWLSVGAQPSDTARTLINRVRRETAAEAPAQAQA